MVLACRMHIEKQRLLAPGAILFVPGRPGADVRIAGA
jgi:hypothetical protein